MSEGGTDTKWVFFWGGGKLSVEEEKLLGRDTQLILFCP